MRNELDAKLAELMAATPRGMLADRVALLVLDKAFENVLARLPEWLREEVEKVALDAPAHPEDVVLIEGGTFRNSDPEALRLGDLSRRTEFFRVAKELRAKLFPMLELPRFEPIRGIGHVSLSLTWRPSDVGIDDERDSAVVLFGSFNEGLVRDHPLILAPPLVTVCVRTGLGQAS